MRVCTFFMYIYEYKLYTFDKLCGCVWLCVYLGVSVIVCVCVGVKTWPFVCFHRFILLFWLLLPFLFYGRSSV